MYLYVPSAKKGKAHKFARLLEDPYRILAVCDNGADIRLINHPQDQPKRVRECP